VPKVLLNFLSVMHKGYALPPTRDSLKDLFSMVIGFCLAWVFDMCCGCGVGMLVGCGVVTGGGSGRLVFWIEGSCICCGGDGCCVCCSGGWGIRVWDSEEGRCYPNGDMGWFWIV
jgi:hypothetical protein